MSEKKQKTKKPDPKRASRFVWGEGDIVITKKKGTEEKPEKPAGK